MQLSHTEPYRKKWNFSLPVSVTLCLCLQQAYAVEEFFTVPGTRAMGMAGAFMAQASDSSAMWYNPAGLAFAFDDRNYFDLQIEAGSQVQRDVNNRDPEGSYISENDIKFATFATGDQRYGFGIALFQPYRFYSSSLLQNSPGSTSSNTAVTLETSYKEIKFGGGIKMLSDNFAVGGTFDFITQETQHENVLLTNGSDSGYGYTLAAMTRLPLTLGENTWKVSGAAVYRSESNISNSRELPTRPSSIGLGGSLDIPMRLMNPTSSHTPVALNLVLNYNYEMITYTNILYPVFSNSTQLVSERFAPEYNRSALGAELKWVINNSYEKSFSLFMRAGIASTEASGASGPVPYMNNIDSSAFGVGIQANQFTLDLATETREIANTSGFYNDFVREDENLYAASVSYSF